MSRPLLFLDPDSDLSLQDQVRRKLVEAACAGAFPPGKRLPSSRGLATQLGVARNTVTLAYQKLLDEGPPTPAEPETSDDETEES